MINVYSATNIGIVRDHNEDDLLTLHSGDQPTGTDAVLVVADGMGGHLAGEVASRMTVAGIREHLREKESVSATIEGSEYGIFLHTIIKEVNESVCVAGRDPDKLGMGTTCTLAAIREDTLFMVHVGDSRAYMIRDSEIHQITTDHSWVQERVDEGSMTQEEARFHPNRNMITRAIGLQRNVEIDVLRLDITPGDLLLLCSDGLNSMITDEEILAVIREAQPDSICNDLIDAANKAGGHDNISVITAQF
ncbi:MAG: hypothetical protein CM1200mP15_18740 [Dehalococcoidia bacterium]|nr:MAG: hypothetical protein CM1200mP15_18740 [Dehalococcoidia bacterium]